MTCACGHEPLSHRYEPATRTNSGRCLSRGCGCAEEGAQNALEIRGNDDVRTWENGGTNSDGPGRCANTVIPGPRRSTKEIDCA